MKLSISDIDPAGKRVLMRVDFNVPLDDEGNITDDTRIKAAIPSIEHLTNAGGRVILMSHLGRPKGEKNPAFSLKPAADRLGELISANVKFVDDCVGADAEARTRKQRAAQAGAIDAAVAAKSRKREKERRKRVRFIECRVS